MRNRVFVNLSFALGLVIFLQPRSVSAQETTPATEISQLDYLLGEWTGEGGGSQPGQGTGGFSFGHELQGKIMVRRNFADYPASEDKPASRHEDLMIIYNESPSTPLKAVYFDSEGHVINYAVSISADQSRIVFMSHPGIPGPRFRLSYIENDENNVEIKFEVAPPDKPDQFSSYIEASARRK